ncbi:hypothetical protein [Arthrobacter sp.]|uniref:hypothetical protein n=1 Tax=Arthrobacter sp. TaxID=1667 RepID=UPI00281274DE|nr:hypothetical protein [Arthrobacter sp.]
MKHKVLAALGAMISAIGLSVASAGPASAKPLEHDHFVDSGSEIAQLADPLFCAGVVGFPVLHEWNAEGLFHFVVHGDGLAYGGGPFRATDVWTNTLNGKTFTITVAGQSRDHKVTDNNDGTLTIEFADTGVQKVYGPDGDRLFMDTGLVRAEVLIDHAGTPADPVDDQFIRFLGETAVHGQADTLGRDFCEDLVTFIG